MPLPERFQAGPLFNAMAGYTLNWVYIQGNRLLVMLVVAVRHILNELFGQLLRFMEFARLQVSHRFLRQVYLRRFSLFHEVIKMMLSIFSVRNSKGRQNHLYMELA